MTLAKIISPITGITEKKKAADIYIKPSKRGSFTKYCDGKVTQDCIDKGKNSPNPAIRKKANFAANARQWGK